MKARYLTPHILSDINDKMVFIGGARQVGKTWLARFIGENNFPAHQYLNWDYAPDRQDILQYRFQGDAKILLFDEIHKYKDWKNYLKGLFDKERESYRMLVTGSARLDVYRRGGDSLMGRYYYYRLHPFSVAEFLESENPLIPGKEIALAGPGATISAVHDLLWRFGGFPEPLMKQNVRFLRRWRTQRQERLVREDIRDLASIRDLSSLQILLDMLPGRVGSLLSLNAVREDLAVDHKTAAHWLEILESFYYAFRIYPFSHNKIKSLRKQPKLYLLDWTEIQHDDGAKLENMVAFHLLKLCHYLSDTQGYRMELNFLRDVDGREVDFLVTADEQPWFAVEVKSSSREISRHLNYFGTRLPIPYLYQLTAEKDVDVKKDGVRLVSADRFLASLV